MLFDELLNDQVVLVLKYTKLVITSANCSLGWFDGLLSQM
jgi:hypothetical protein